MNHTDKIYTNKKHILKEVDEIFKKAYEMGYRDGHYVSETRERDLKKAYEDGQKDAWTLYKKLYTETPQVDLADIFDGIVSVEQIIKLYSPQAISEKIEMFERRSIIKVGDEVLNTNNGTKAVVLEIDGDVAKVYEQRIGFNHPPISALRPLGE